MVLAWNTWKQDRGWLVVIVCGLLWLLGVSFYLYEPISGMTVPPMQWGYPRTVEGFFHALSRGQYEQANPTDVLHDPMHFLLQLGLLISGLAGSFSWVFLFVALVPFFFLLKMQKRERAWIIGLTAIYFCVGILLTVLMNTTPDRQSAEENKVFFTASHAVVAIMIGYGLALLSSYMATHYRSFRSVGLMLGAITLLPALVVLFDGVGTTFYGGVGAMTYQKTLFLFLSMVGGLCAGGPGRALVHQKNQDRRRMTISWLDVRRHGGALFGHCGVSGFFRGRPAGLPSSLSGVAAHFRAEPIQPSGLGGAAGCGRCRRLHRRPGDLSQPRPDADYLVPVRRRAGLFGLVALGEGRGAQPLVRLLVRA